jgi:peptidyl-prolyl cis-trans isomerase C
MRFHKLASAAVCAATGMLAFGACHAQEVANVAVVNGVPIPQSRMEYVVTTQVQQGQQDDAALRTNVKEVLITREILAQEAVKKGLDQDPHVQTQLEMAKQEFLIRAYFDDFIKANPVTDEELQAEYERVKAEQTNNGERKEYQARHILVQVQPKDVENKAKWTAAEKKAKGLLTQINKAKGKNFAQLAKASSDDSGSKAEGGLLDWSDGSNYVQEFTDALLKLDKGQYTRQLVKTRYGFHIIKLEDVREMQFPPFEQVQERIQQQLLAQKRDKAIEALRASAKIE